MEDSKTDVYLIREAMQRAAIDADIEVLQDGYSATLYLGTTGEDASAPCPDLILLDLNLPKMSGQEVLDRLGSGHRCRHTQVLIVSSSDAIADREAAKARRVAGYFKKPSNYDDFMRLGVVVKELLSRIQT